MNVFTLIKDRVAILDVVSQYTTLKKAGSYYKGTCPFHSEKTASFTVSPDKSIYYCFGCHAGGDVISFIAKVENFSQKQAAEHLANQFGIEIPELGEYKNDQEAKVKYYDLCSLIAQWCHEQLKKTPQVIDYFLARGITKRSMVNFQLGYMPREKKQLDQLIQLLQKNHFLVQDLLDAKIFLQGKSGLYTPFEDRLIFPIKDHLGRFCGFGGRVFKEQDDRAKYYNSHDHAFFSKGSILFGLDTAKKGIQNEEVVFMVEGYTDVISMAQHGYINTVATLGTACTMDHLKILARYTQKLYVIYDGDTAGQKAILRLTELSWQASLDTYVMQLPETEDPASLLQKKIDLKPYIASAVDILTFYVHYLTKDFKQKGMQDKLIISQKLLETIKDISDPIKQDMLLKQISVACDISFDTLRISLRKMQGNYWGKSPEEEHKQKSPQKEQIPGEIVDNNIHDELEKKLFSAIINNYEPLLSEDIESMVTELSELHNGLLFKKVFQIKLANHKASIGDIFTLLTDEEKRILSGMLIEESTSLTLKNVLAQWYRKQWKYMIHKVKLNIELAQKAGDAFRVKELLNELDELKKKMLKRGIA